MLGISASLSSPIRGPSSLGLCSSMEDSDDDGTAVFRRQAQECSPGYHIPRTRSQNKADLSMIEADGPENTQKKTLFGIGDFVFAHKGKMIPCWFPGTVQEQTKKGFKVDFFAGFGQEDCVIGNMMPFLDYEQKKKNGAKSKLFQIPKKFEEDFVKALDLANKKCSSDK